MKTQKCLVERRETSEIARLRLVESEESFQDL